MKTNTKLNSELKSRSAQHGQNKLPKLDFAKRRVNRQLPAEEVLNLLDNEAPLLCRMAQIVGKWVWIQFPERQSREITSLLSQVGFHWNKNRQIWQHPCGIFCDRAATYDPRNRYGSQAAA